jgi:LAS superfamily LD-carboxypeptidase LdcB
MAFNLGNLAPLAGLMESDKLLQQRQINQLRQREMMQNLQMGDQQQQALGALWPALQQSSQQQQQPIPQIPQPPTSPAMQAGAGQPTSPLLSPNLAGSGVNWQGESPELKQRVSSMLSDAPPDVRAASSVDSGFRTNQQQADIYERSGQGTKFMAAPPGKSLHETGQAADWSFKSPEADQWVHQNAGRYGLGFPLGSRDPNHMQLAAYKKLDASLDQSGNKLIQQGIDGPTVQDSTKAGMMAGRQIDPVQWGRATRNDLIQAIDKSNPDLAPAVKALTFLQMNKILAPEEKMQAQMWAREHQQDLLVALKEAQIKSTEGIASARIASAEGIASERVRVAEDRLAQGTGTSKAFSLTAPDGAKQQVFGKFIKPGTFLDEGSGKQIDTSGYKVEPARAPGRQAQQQIMSMINAGNEATASLDNAVDLSINATLGPFVGAQAAHPGGLVEGLQKSMANTVTPQSAQAINTTFAGIGRFLAQLEATGRATGLVGLSNMSAEALTPKLGDTPLEILRKYAEIRQIIERSSESALSSGEVGDDQRKLLQRNIDQVAKSVPWTVKDVNALERNPKQEKVNEFARRIGAAGAGGDTSPGSIIERGGKRYRIVGGDPKDPDVEEVK